MDSKKLAELFEYREGKLFWRNAPSRRIKAGSRAGVLRPTGYRQIKIQGKNYLEHRLIWCLLKGSWPAFEIDHINRQRDDNRIGNLRDVSHEKNMVNTLRGENKKGYYFDTHRKKYRVYIKIKGKLKFLGRYQTEEEAKRARKKAEIIYCAVLENKR